MKTGHWKWMLGALAMTAVVGLPAYFVGLAHAEGVPSQDPLTYFGLLEQNGAAFDGVKAMTLRLWSAASNGNQLCSTSPAGGVQVQKGRFKIILDKSCVDAVRANPEVWTELQVDTETMPRSKLGAVPYALEATRSTIAKGLDCTGCVTSTQPAPGANAALEARIAALESAWTVSAAFVSGDFYNTSWKINQQVPNWIASVSADCSGYCRATITLASGVFSAAPSCMVANRCSPDNATCRGAVVSTSASQVVVDSGWYNSGGTPEKSIMPFQIVCTGPR